MSERQRRQRRLIAGSLVVLLAAGMAYVLRSAVTAHAQPAHAAARVHAIAPPLTPASQPTTTGARSRVASSASGSPPATALGVRTSTAHAGVPTPAPSPRSVSQALKQATGLAPAQVTSRAVCPRAATGHASCAAQTLVLRSTGAPVRPHVAKYHSLGRVAPAHGTHPASIPAAAPPTAYTPAYLQQAYNLTALSQTGGTGDTVAIVDAYDDPTAQSDLAVYRSNYGLPACGSGCFQKVNQNGSSSSLPAPNASWEQEIALDLDAVSAVCPQCHILLVEANSSGFSDLQAAMQTAANLGAKQISASWGGVSSSVPSVLRTFSGVATVAATGDYGYVGAGQDQYPAALPGVTAAGGTSLATATSARGFGEAAWSWDGLTGGGSGCDLRFSRPVYQPAAGCAGRAYADLSADADPQTGLEVYDNGSWSLVGGTSLSTPLVAAYYAITGVAGATPSWAYGASSSLNDVVSGSTGNCAAGITYICSAGPGYDGPTGVGSISGSVVTGAPGIGGPTIATGSGNGNTYTKSTRSDGATLTAGIYPNGLDTRWSIQYWPASGGSVQQTAAADIGSGTTPVTVTGYLSHLASNTQYDYQLVATNSAGTIYGYTYSFTTTAASATTPVAAFTSSPAAAKPGSAVSFDATASTDSGAAITDYSWDFGDGTTQDAKSTPTTSHSYAGRGTYAVTLTVTNTAGQTAITTHTVAVDDAPTLSLSPATAITAPNLPMSFTATASSPDPGGSIAGYGWNFGDPGSTGNTATGASASHTYSSPGRYSVTVTATDDLGVSTTTTGHVTIDAPPTASFTASPNQPSPRSAVGFDASGSTDSVGTITDYSWDFGDGSTKDTGSTPTTNHAYATRRTYTVTLTVTNDAGQTATSTHTVTVDDPPTATLSPSTTITTPGSPVTFSSVAASPDPGGSITSYGWNFGDPGSTGNTATGASASHTYTSPGRYSVTVTATDDLGVSTTTTGHVTIDAPPTASFTASPIQPSPGSSVGFDATGSSDSVGTITDYRWDFGDRSTQDKGSTPTTNHAYATRGSYTVTLTVTNDAGQTATSTHTVTVDDPPTATLSPSTTLTTPGSPVTFNSLAASPDPGGSITSSWNFGDPGSAGNTATGATASHTYSSPGTYSVTLIVTDDLGLQTTKTVQITVDAAPTAAFTISPNPVTVGSGVGFDATGSSDSVGTITGYSWNFGDPSGANDTATGRATSHVYATPGTYTVTLNVTNDAGQAATRTATVIVNSVPTPPQQSSPSPAPAPAPAASPTPAPAPTPLTASLTATKKQKLASVLPNGLRVGLALSQSATARFQVTLPRPKGRLARGNAKTTAIVLLRPRAQTLPAGTHGIRLKLPRGAARELAGSGPLVVTVRVTLTTATGGTVTRSVKITLTR